MIPAGLTLTSLLTDAALVVGEFDGLITLVAAMSIGFTVVGWLIAKLRNSTY